MALELTEEQKKAGWQVKQLGELCEAIDYGFTASATDEDTGTKFLRITDIKSGYCDAESVPFVEVNETERAKYLLHDGDIVVARTGATTGVSAWLKNPKDTIFASYLVRFTVNKSEYNSRFVGYLLKTETFKKYIYSVLAEKSAQPNASAATIAKATFYIPPLEEQNQIAEILGSVDDKIEANSRLLDSLDELLRFEYLAIQGDSELKISDIASEVKDGVAPTDILPDEVYVGLEHLPRRDVWFRDWGRGEEVTSNKSRFKKGDILFGKLRPYFHKVVVAPVDGICSTDIIVARPKPGFESLALQALSSDAVVEHASNASNGTRMPRAKWSDLKDLEVRGSAEPKSVVSFELAAALVTENRKLAETRDLLIRQLIK